MRTEKEFLNTLETYTKVTISRLKDGRIIDAHEQLELILKMINHRQQEVEGTAAWMIKTKPLTAKEERELIDRALSGSLLTFIPNDIETITPARPKAYWRGIEFDSYADGFPVWDLWECTNCGHEHNGEVDTLTAYCPDCGAEMEEKT